uniref:General transcription factor II-I repeat domain-containing protein 1-like n=1 Tax=Phallusia mammillata TaxID=59560 RepID=A0A6F9DDM2_9ASCI|nr:general transcription factor II-I repeat domain-containing protein 1-like [Phallusia mammillata]
MRSKCGRSASGYNLFCASLKGGEISTFGKEWQNLSESEKNTWKEKAKQSIQPNMTERQQKSYIKRQTDMITHCSKNLEKVNVEVVGMVLKSGVLQVFGTNKSVQWLENTIDVQRQFVCNSHLDGCNTVENTLRENLRRMVQDLFNSKYSEAVGKASRVPYKKRNYTVTGLPEGVSFSKPSKYGVLKLKQILSVKENIMFTVDRIATNIELGKNSEDDQIPNDAQQNVTMEGDDQHVAEEQEEENTVTAESSNETNKEHLQSQPDGRRLKRRKKGKPFSKRKVSKSKWTPKQLDTLRNEPENYCSGCGEFYYTSTQENEDWVMCACGSFHHEFSCQCHCK